MLRRLITITAGAFALTACGDGIAPVLHSDVERARADWLEHRPPAYLYDVTVVAQTGEHRFRVTVENHVAISSVLLKPGSLGPFLVTIDDIWTHLLAAVEQGNVNSVLFDGRGIPVRLDTGSWALDGGVAYEITRFQRR